MVSNNKNTPNENFDLALELCQNSYSYPQLIEFLKNGNIAQKQFAAIEINELKSLQDSEIFISNLVNCDGKIREAVAQKLSQFILNNTLKSYFSQFPNILAQATIDINANISRLVIESLKHLKENKTFATQYTNRLLTYIDEAFEGLSKIIYKDKKYTVNKQLFKLYWCLEGLNNFYQYLSPTKLQEILEKSLLQNEYTIREKVAQLLSNPDLKTKYPNLQKQLASDENYYVKRIFE